MRLRLLLVCFVMLTVLGIGLLLIDDGPAQENGRDPASNAAAPWIDVPMPLPDALPDRDGAQAPAPLHPEAMGDAELDEQSASGFAILADGSVAGRVVDPSGVALKGVPVLLFITDDPWQEEVDGDDHTLKIGSTKTDANGAFVLPARSGASHVLLAGGISWARVRVEDVATADELLVHLEDPRWIEGVVQDEETGEPIEGAHVLVIGGAESLVGTTDPDGAFRVEPLPFEDVIVAAWAPGHEIGFDTGALTGWEPLVVELPPGRDVQGSVLERESRVPIEGAEVRFSMNVAARVVGAEQNDLEAHEETVYEKTVVTDADGVFVIEGVASSGFELSITADGFEPLQLNHYVDRNLSADEEVSALMRVLTEVHGRVVVGVDQVRVPGAVVELTSGGTRLASTEADETGEFGFELTDWDGRGALRVTALGSDGLRGLVRVRNRPSAEDLLVHLVEPVPLTIAVVAGESPLAGAQVSVHSGSGPDERTLVSTGADGTVELVHPRSSPAVERLIVQARYGGRQSLKLELDLSEDLPGEPILLDVDSGIWIEGQVADPFGTPIPGASLWVRGAVSVHADQQGHFRLGPLEEGRSVKVSASAAGFRKGRETIPELSPWMGELLITLDPIVLWEGRVVDSSTGFPIEDYHARLQKERDTDKGLVFRNSSARVERVVGEPGAFTAELSSSGRYRMRVFSKDFIEAFSDPLVFDGSTQPAELEMFISPAAVLHLTVLDSAGRPVPGFSVVAVDDAVADDPGARKKARKQRSSQRTDSSGVARFNLAEGGVYRLASGSVGWLMPERLTVTPGPVVERTHYLPPSGALVLRITDEIDTPLSRPRITVRATGKKRKYEVLRRSSPRGSPEEVLFDVLPPGEYSVQVRARGFSTQKTTTVVLANRQQHERLVLRRPQPGTRR